MQPVFRIEKYIWKSEEKSRSFSGMAGDADIAIVKSHDFFYDRQPQSGASFSPRGLGAQRLERPEEHFLVFLGNARTFVPHGKLDAVAQVFSGDVDLASLRGEFYCVADQVVDSLNDSVFVEGKGGVWGEVV